MVAERLTPQAIAHELDILDGQAKLVAGGLVVTLAFTNAAVKDLAPREWEEVSAYVYALLEREPMKSSAAFVGHRIVLGSLASELRGFAAAVGEPVGLQVDLRAATTQAEERRLRERVADDEAAYDRHIDDVLRAQIVRQMARPDTDQEEPASEPDAATPTETTDVPAWL